MTYTFIVESGNDPNDGPNYHPFYITNSDEGGILLDTLEDRMVSENCLDISLHFNWYLNYRERMNKCLLVMTWIPTNLLLVCMYMFNANNPYSCIPPAGRLCEHVETEDSAAVAENCDSELQDYLDTLDVTCQSNESDAAILSWTPDDNTPDIVYYQVSSPFIALYIAIGALIIVIVAKLTQKCGGAIDLARNISEKLHEQLKYSYNLWGPFLSA